MDAEARRDARQARSRPLVAELHAWFAAGMAKLPARSPTAEAIRYALNHWHGLSQFLDDGRIEIDNNSVERAMRPIAMRRSLCPLPQVSGNIGSWFSRLMRHGRPVRPIAAMTRSSWRSEAWIW